MLRRRRLLSRKKRHEGSMHGLEMQASSFELMENQMDKTMESGTTPAYYVAASIIVGNVVAQVGQQHR